MIVARALPSSSTATAAQPVWPHCVRPSLEPSQQTSVSTAHINDAQSVRVLGEASGTNLVHEGNLVVVFGLANLFLERQCLVLFGEQVVSTNVKLVLSPNL